MSAWAAHLAREVERYRDGEARLPDDLDERQRQLTRMGNAAGGAGLACLMLRDAVNAREWLAAAADRYRESWAGAPAGSWGRPIGAVKARVLAGDWDGAAQDAAWPLEAGAAEAASSIGLYAACLALLVLGRDEEARPLAERLRGHDDFPDDVATALGAIAARDEGRVRAACASVLRSFETRDAYLEDIPVADTVLVLQALAARRGISVPLSSELLPS